VVDQAVQRLVVEGDAQVDAAGEVGGAEAAGVVGLIQGAELAVGEATRKAAVQVFKEGLGLETGG
jgi:hypothetical protein